MSSRFYSWADLRLAALFRAQSPMTTEPLEQQSWWPELLEIKRLIREEVLVESALSSHPLPLIDIPLLPEDAP